MTDAERDALFDTDDQLSAYRALEAERDELKAYLRQRCSLHPGEALDLICAECFESDRTADANERAEAAEAERDHLQAQLAALRHQVEHLASEWAHHALYVYRDCAAELRARLTPAPSPSSPWNDADTSQT